MSHSSSNAAEPVPGGTDALWERLRGEGPDRDRAIAELRAVLVRGLRRSLSGRYGTEFAVDDVVQEALVKILASLDRFEGRSRFVTWAMTVATRIGISALRRKHHRDLSLDAFEDSEGRRIDVAPAAPDDRPRAELLQTLQHVIDQGLTARQQTALRAVLDGYSTDGIAERLGINRNAVYKLIHDARTRLKQGLEAEGVTAEDVATALA